MPTLNLNQANKLYWGNTEVQKLYKGSQQLYPNIIISFTHWRVDYNYSLAEIQLEENQNNNPIVLNTPDISFNRLSSLPPLRKGELNDNILSSNNNQYIGSGTDINHSYEIIFSSPKNITGVFLSPQSTATLVYNPCTYCRLYYKTTPIESWILLKEWIVTNPFNSTMGSPYSNTLLRPNQLIKLSV